MRIQETEILNDFLIGIDKQKYVIPDFQREFVWDPERISQLIISIIGDYFTGVLLILENDADGSIFSLKSVEGVQSLQQQTPKGDVRIILDGQQRTSSLYYAFRRPDVPLKDRRYPHYFYIDLEAIFANESDKCVVYTSSQAKTKFETFEKEKNI